MVLYAIITWQVSPPPLWDDIVVVRVVPIVREGKEVGEVWETRQRKQS